jgi:SAM-dependent methyltransferase
MGKEINLLKKYPRTNRNSKNRSISKTAKDIKIAKKFGKEYFDGDRKYGYGGYFYNPIFWEGVSEDIIQYYALDKNSKVLDIGSGKGFLMYELKKKIPELYIRGIDISKYAIQNSKKEIKKFQNYGNAENLPFIDKSFDLAISLVTLHNLNKEKCGKALKEISRVSINSFITLDAYSNKKEKIEMFEWNLTAETIMSVDAWKDFFKENNYTGDYFWFKP